LPDRHHAATFRHRRMEKSNQSLAWLARRDGTVLVGHGPFESNSSIEGLDTAFFIQDFALQDPEPWKIPNRVERVSTEEFSNFFPITRPTAASWQSSDPAPFSEVFQEIMTAIHGGVFEKTVPVVTESGHAGQPPYPSV